MDTRRSGSSIAVRGGATQSKLFARDRSHGTNKKPVAGISGLLFRTRRYVTLDGGRHWFAVTFVSLSEVPNEHGWLVTCSNFAVKSFRNENAAKKYRQRLLNNIGKLAIIIELASHHGGFVNFLPRVTETRRTVER